MLSEWLILTCGFILLTYWFRHNCRAILRARFPRDCARQVARANHLSFLEAQFRLQDGASRKDLDSINQSLISDYRVLTYLLRHMAEFEPAIYSSEERILMLYFRIMQIWYLLTRSLHQKEARKTLGQMSQVLNHLANRMGQRTLPASEFTKI